MYVVYISKLFPKNFFYFLYGWWGFPHSNTPPNDARSVLGGLTLTSFNL
jgi:hypothetical protein